MLFATGLAGCGAQPGHAATAGPSGSRSPATSAGSSAAPTGSGTDRMGVPVTPRTTATGRRTPPPWNAPSDVTGRVAAAGLPMLGAEGQVMHIHVHLDVLVDGRPVVVPALVGIDEGAGRISPLHTHDTSGVIHVESPVRASFTLGQFMTEWDVALDADRLGGLRTDAGHRLRVFVDGRAHQGDPAAITLRAHDEIALVYGPVGERVRIPDGYRWPPGL